MKDARHFQIVFLTGFLLYGILVLDWDVEAWNFLAVFLTAGLTQAAFAYWKGQDLSSLKSSLISSLSLCILLKANYWYIYALAAFLAIAGKYLLRFQGKHLFNPANFGIIAAILLTHEAWISPGQWGSSAVAVFVVITCGAAVLFKVGRIDTGLAFAATFLLCHFGLYVYSRGWPIDFFTHQAFNGALWLFSLFMITDPMTSPDNRVARIIWAVGTAVVAFYLQAFYWVNGAPLWVLFFVTPLTVVFDKVLKGKRFTWLPTTAEAKG